MGPINCYKLPLGISHFIFIFYITTVLARLMYWQKRRKKEFKTHFLPLYHLTIYLFARSVALSFKLKCLVFAHLLKRSQGNLCTAFDKRYIRRWIELVEKGILTNEVPRLSTEINFNELNENESKNVLK